MNVRKVLLSLSIAVIAATIFSACKKSSSSPSTNNNSQLIGTWRGTYTATDANNNNVPDASEQVALSGGDYDYWTFMSDGTGQDSARHGLSSGVTSVEWSVSNSYITLVISGSLTLVAKVYQLDNSNFVLQDTSAHPTEWNGFVKQ